MITTGGSPPRSWRGVNGPTSSHTAPACSGSGGATSTTWRPRSSAAFASSSVTRSSIVNERLVCSGQYQTHRRSSGEQCLVRHHGSVTPYCSPPVRLFLFPTTYFPAYFEAGEKATIT